MKPLAVSAGAIGLVLAACSQAGSELTPEELANVQAAVSEPKTAPEDEPAIVRIARALAYRQGILRLCGDTSTLSDDFLDELALSAMPAADLGRAVEATEQATREFTDAEEEYVCTPEMFEQSETAATEALAEWALIKELAQ